MDKPAHYPREDAPAAMVEAAEPYEQRFQIRFASLTWFPRSLFAQLHAVEGSTDEPPANALVASRSDPSIVPDIEILTRVANNPAPTPDDRRDYLEALLRMYRKLPRHPADVDRDQRSLYVGVEREGRILAEQLGWLPAGRGLCLHAKRIGYQGGLLVGLTEVADIPPCARCVIIDGAIASGATTLALVERFRNVTAAFHIFSVHSTLEGLRALARHSKETGLDLSVTVGHATDGLNAKFYAIEQGNPRRVVVGDLGDTISDLRA